jgi:galactokinase
MSKSFNDYFGASNEPIFSSSANGRLDVMGGFADYSGSLVLQKLISEKTTIGIRKTNNNHLIIKSIVENKTLSFDISLEKIMSIPVGNYELTRKLFLNNHWASYIVGGLILLLWEKKISLTGFEILIESDIPIGKGVSSSAALEVATLKVFSQYFNLTFDGTELPTLAQKVENLIAGSPCGIMDQLAVCFGKENHLLPITCQPDILHELMPIPDCVSFVGIDSGLSHETGGKDYARARTAAFMGYSIIAQIEGIDRYDLSNLSRSNLPYHGYLANIYPPVFRKKYFRNFPKNLSGKDFIEQYGNVSDSISQINPDEIYPILTATRHAFLENERIKRFQRNLPFINQKEIRKSTLRLMGDLMDHSHKSYSDCGLGSPQTDELVEMVNNKRLGQVYGAKITGGGSGGTVCILCEGEEGKDTARKIWQEYQQKYEINVAFFE